MYFEWSTLKVLLPSITWKQKGMECHWKHIPLEATKSLCVSVFGKCTKSKVIWLVVDEMTSYDARLNNILLASEMLCLVCCVVKHWEGTKWRLWLSRIVLERPLQENSIQCLFVCKDSKHVKICFWQRNLLKNQCLEVATFTSRSSKNHTSIFCKALYLLGLLDIQLSCHKSADHPKIPQGFLLFSKYGGQKPTILVF